MIPYYLNLYFSLIRCVQKIVYLHYHIAIQFWLVPQQRTYSGTQVIYTVLQHSRGATADDVEHAHFRLFAYDEYKFASWCYHRQRHTEL